MKFKIVILRDHDNFSISMFFVLRIFFPLRSSFFNLSLLFLSPCGVLGMKVADQLQSGLINTDRVSVPLRGYRHERFTSVKFFKINNQKVSVPLRGYRHESTLTIKDTVAVSMFCFHPLAGL
jgi:hypothetical protein